MQDIFQLQNPWRYKKELTFFHSYRNRDILKELFNNLENPKILGLIGSRQVGKSSILYLLIVHLINNNVPRECIFYFNLDDYRLHPLFEDITALLEFVGQDENKKILFIDEIQRLKNPGLFLKELVDLHLNIKIIYSGSSQIEIKSKLKEYLVGRARQFEIHRLSFNEYLNFRKPITKEEALQDYLLFGSYPEVALANTHQERMIVLRDIIQSYVQKDIVEFLHVENAAAFNKLLILLAHQMGLLLNINNISKSLGISHYEVQKYITILEQTFIIKLIYPFYRNYKKEITKTPKVYFYDLGLRNFLLKKFETLTTRDDVGELFENFYLIQLLHQDPYNLTTINFWRTTNQTEIDFIIQSAQALKAIEVKWQKSTSPKSFKTLKHYYPEIQTQLMTHEKFLHINR